MPKPKAFVRADRVADLIQRILATKLLEMGDARFKLVTITSVQLSKDFSYAKIYVTILLDEEEEIKSLIKALNHAAKYLRRELGAAIKIRLTPELKFIYDESTATGFKLSSLIHDAMKKTGNSSDDNES